MAGPEAVQELLNNKYFLFGLIVVAIVLGQVVKRWLVRIKQKHQNRIDPPQ